MRLLALFFLVSTLLPLGALAEKIKIETTHGAKSGRHIVVLKQGIDRRSVLKKIAHLSTKQPSYNVTHEWDLAINGFAGFFNQKVLGILQTVPGIKAIVEDGIANATATQFDAPWGLARINSQRRLGVDYNTLTFTFNYDERAGKGVDIYILDTGIHRSHEDFGGRAFRGETFGGYGEADLFGHGTHCAATAVGTKYGVAKRAKVYAVKVLGDDGFGDWSDIISGINFSLGAAKASGKPSIISISIGGPVNSAVDDAARNAVRQGVHVVVAAGNNNRDTSGFSPSRVKEVITVGASTIQDERRWNSNFGPGVDVFGPGENVLSASSASDTATKLDSGTSMAAPHVAGLIASFISIHGNISPAEMREKIRAKSLKGILNPYTLPPGTVNKVVANQYKMQT